MALRTKKKKKQSKKSRTSKIKTDRSILEEIIRVDHAGEYGATRIYDGQIAIFGKNSIPLPKEAYSTCTKISSEKAPNKILPG